MTRARSRSPPGVDDVAVAAVPESPRGDVATRGKARGSGDAGFEGGDAARRTVSPSQEGQAEAQYEHTRRRINQTCHVSSVSL